MGIGRVPVNLIMGSGRSVLRICHASNANLFTWQPLYRESFVRDSSGLQ